MFFIRATPKTGFTLLEVLLTVTLMGVLAGLALPIVPRWLQLNDVDVVANTVAQSLRRAQVQAQSGAGDTSWGVSVDASDNDQIVLFQGASYAARDTAYDEVFELPATIAVSGVSEVVFAVLTGEPGATGTVTLTTNTNQVRTVVVNAVGGISY